MATHHPPPTHHSGRDHTVATHIFHVRPLGWEDEPEEERFDLSTLDYLVTQAWNNYAVFFRLRGGHSVPNIIDVLQKGLGRTLSQTRHYCGIIEKNRVGHGGHSFVKKRGSAVRFVVQRLDQAPEGTYPSIDEIEAAHFVLGDREPVWGVPGLLHRYGQPEAHPDREPVVSAFLANFVRGGLVLHMHNHHYANDIMGWASFLHQWAGNCRAVLDPAVPFPRWDRANLDASRVTAAEPPESEKIDGPPPPGRHKDHTEEGVILQFHLSRSRAAELKRLASSELAGQEEEENCWISTYDAFAAFIWRTLSRLRAPLYNPDPSAPLFWCEAVDLRRRFRDPALPSQLQRNAAAAAVSLATANPPPPKVGEVVSAWPLGRLARYVRRMTNSVTEGQVGAALAQAARVRDKGALSVRIDTRPPMSLLITDHRRVDVASADFGFASPLAYRHLSDNRDVPIGNVIVYPPRAAAPGGPSTGEESDEGPEFAISFERSLAEALIEDAEWARYFEFRGVDSPSDTKSKP